MQLSLCTNYIQQLLSLTANMTTNLIIHEGKFYQIQNTSGHTIRQQRNGIVMSRWVSPGNTSNSTKICTDNKNKLNETASTSHFSIPLRQNPQFFFPGQSSEIMASTTWSRLTDRVQKEKDPFRIPGLPADFRNYQTYRLPDRMGLSKMDRS